MQVDGRFRSRKGGVCHAFQRLSRRRSGGRPCAPTTPGHKECEAKSRRWRVAMNQQGSRIAAHGAVRLNGARPRHRSRAPRHPLRVEGHRPRLRSHPVNSMTQTRLLPRSGGALSDPGGILHHARNSCAAAVYCTAAQSYSRAVGADQQY